MTNAPTDGNRLSSGDGELVRRCRAGDRTAQAEFIVRFKTGVFRRMLRLTGAYELAEDLTQETLVRALTRLDSFQTNVSLDGWVYRIASNLANDYFRAAKVRNERPLEAATNSVMDVDAADTRLVGEEERTLVAKALASLPESYREVLMLAHYDDKSVQDIADKLGVGLSAVKMRLLRGRTMLLKALEKLYD